MSTLILLFLTVLLSFNARAQQTLFPAAIPLAVRSPYLTSWDFVTNGSIVGQLWPTTFNSRQILGWAVLVRVDGTTYSFLGDSVSSVVNGTVNQTGVVVTPTRTIITAQAAQMQVNLTFLNPIEPRDWVKQSVPFSYMSFTAKSLDGLSHAVQVYSDVSGEWNSGDRTQKITWSANNSTSVIFHAVRLQTPAVFNEISEQAEWGTLYYAMEMGNGVTFKISADDTSRGLFQSKGILDNQVDKAFRAISSSFAVFAISRDLGNIQATQAPVVWTVGYTTDPAINYTDLSGASMQRSLYYKSQYPQDGPLVSGGISYGDGVAETQIQIVDFLSNFTNASSTAQQLDQKILQDAASVHNLLGDLVSLALPQVYGSTQLTIGIDAVGNLNGSDVMMFMKNIGGANSNRVNAVETLYAAFPALMYIDPSLGAPLLEPLFRFQASPKYTIPFAAADLGSNFPNVTGTNSSNDQGVEQSGNMLIMTYAQARASGDGSLISRYYRLLSRWADYLTNNTLFIHDQSSADNLSVSNQTNLAIKGIIAIEAMSKMSSIVQQSDDAERYSNAAAQLYGQWKSLALSNGHLLAVYGQTNSWTLGYNLFADVWLGTNLVESSVYNGHSSFIDNVTLMSSFSNFGMPVDNILQDTEVAVSCWDLFTAAMTPSQDLRSNLIARVHNRASFNTSTDVFPFSYSSNDGSTVQGAASPAQGAMFAPLALKAQVLPIKAGTVTQTSGKASHSHKVTGWILGVAAVLLVLAVIGAIILVRRRRRLDRRKSVGSSMASVEAGPGGTITPFNPNPIEATDHEPATLMVQQQLLSVAPEVEPAPDLHVISSTVTLPPQAVVPPPRPVPPVPAAGLSSKQLARLRMEALSSEQPSGQSSSSNGSPSQSTSPSTVVTGQSGGTSSSETRRLQSEVESLRREMRELRTERFDAPPPSYSEGGVGP